MLKYLNLIEFFSQQVERTIKTRGTQRVLKCILNRTEEMEDISSMKLSHNCFVGALFIYSLELQDLMNKISYMATICKDIYAVAPNQKIDEQLFKCQINKCERIDDVVKPSKAVTYGETVLICYLSVGAIELVCALFRFCEAMATKCSNSPEFFYSGLLSGVTSGFIFCVFYILLRIFIKVKFSESLASKVWYWIKTGFLVFCSVVGLTCGILGATLMFSKIKEFQEPQEPLEARNTTTIRPETKSEYMNYVYFSQAFGLFFFLTIVFSFLIILKFLGYLGTTSEPDLELAKSDRSKPTKVIDQNTDRIASVSPQLRNKETSEENLFQENRPASKESTGTTYYKQLIQNQKDVASVSQYNRF